MSSVDPLIDRQLAQLRDEANRLFTDSGTEAIHADMFAAAGKWLRPQLLLRVASLGDPNWEDARRAALAVELLHVGTLYHDDLVDRSPTRRGVAAVHLRLGAEVAAFGGAHLLCLGNSLVASFPPNLARSWGRTMLEIADGQLRETENTGSLDLSAHEYERIVSKKTASLFALSAEFGADIAGVPARTRSALRSFGRELGIAFQLVDDLDDYVTSPGEHRPGFTDLRERVYTLPVILTCSKGDAVARELRDLLSDDGRALAPDRIRNACRLMTTSGSFVAAANRADLYLARARRQLATLTNGVARDALEDLLSRFAAPTIPGFE